MLILAGVVIGFQFALIVGFLYRERESQRAVKAWRECAAAWEETAAVASRGWSAAITSFKETTTQRRTH